MRIRNESRLDDSLLDTVLRFSAWRCGDERVLVHVIDTTTHFRGWAFGRGSFTKRRWSREDERMVQKYPDSVDFLIRLFIPAKIPLRSWTNVKRIRDAYPGGLPPVLTEACALVLLGAHEFRHIWQYRNRKRGKGEYDAEKWAFRRLNDWRQQCGLPRVDPVKRPNPFARKAAANVQRPEADVGPVFCSRY